MQHIIQALIPWMFTLPLCLLTQTYENANVRPSILRLACVTSIYIYVYIVYIRLKTPETKTWRLMVINVEYALRQWFWCSIGDLPEQAGPLKFFYASVMYYGVMALLERPTLIFFIPAAGTLKGTSDNRVVENITAQRLSKQHSPLDHYRRSFTRKWL